MPQEHNHTLLTAITIADNLIARGLRCLFRILCRSFRLGGTNLSTGGGALRTVKFSQRPHLQCYHDKKEQRHQDIAVASEPIYQARHQR